jgi:hypothetical protein
MRWTVVALVATALFAVGCGSSSSSQSSRTAEQPPPSPETTAPANAAGRHGEKPVPKGKAEALRQVVEGSSPGTSPGGRVLRGAAVRRIVQKLISSGSSHGPNRVKTNVRKALREILHPGKDNAHSGANAKRGVSAIAQEILSKVGGK